MMKTSPAGPKRPSKSSRAGYDVPFHLSRKESAHVGSQSQARGPRVPEAEVVPCRLIFSTGCRPPLPPSGLLPGPRPIVLGKEEPADGGGKDSGQPAASGSLFEEWMRHWIAGRPDAPRPDGTATKNGSSGARP